MISEEFHHQGFVIRDYHKGDFPGINNLWQELDLNPVNRGDDETTIENSIVIGGKMLVIEEKISSAICGTCWMTFDGRRFHMHHFGICKKHQAKGLARSLLRQSLLFVQTKGFQVKLEVLRTNQKGIDLYKKAGFKYLGDYDVYIIRDLKVIDEYPM
jgi:ribosomal protein S18 acetylase RimI-like enzyme